MRQNDIFCSNQIFWQKICWGGGFLYFCSTNQNITLMSNIKCPKCGSEQIHAGNRGFSTGKAVAGTLIAGPVAGGLAGAVGSGKVKLTCLKCGHTFNPGDKPQQLPQAKWTKRSLKRWLTLTAVVAILCIILAINNSSFGWIALSLFGYLVASVIIIESK